MATTAWTLTVPVSTSWNIVTFPSTFEGFTIINQGPDEVYVYCNPPAGFSEQVYHVSIHGEQSTLTSFMVFLSLGWLYSPPDLVL